MVHKADGTGRSAQRKFRLSKISKIRLRRQMGFWIGMLTCKGVFCLFFISLSQIITLEMLGFFYIADNKISTRKLGGSYT